MADRGRDLKFSILSDVSQLDVDGPARDLEKLGDAAQDTGRQLDRLEDDANAAGRKLDALGDDAATSGRKLDNLEDDAKAAGKSLDGLADDAHTTAKRVDDAFDAIARSSRQGTKAVDDDTRKAGEGFDDLKEEAGSTGREAAASFSGSFDDIASGIQEVAANAFAGFGPAGAAAGLVAAAGIGILVTKMQEAKERVKEVATELIDAGGRIGDDGLFARIADQATEGRLDKLAKSARTLGINVTDLSAIFRDSSSARAFLSTLDEIGTAQETVTKSTGRGIDVSKIGTFQRDREVTLTVAQKNALNELRSATEGSVKEFEKAEKVARLYEEVTGTSLETVENYADAMAGLTDAQGPLADSIEAAAKRTADATKSTEDSWQDYSDTATASIDDVIAKQLEQLTAAEDMQANTKKVLDTAGQDAVDWALAQGENADKAMQLLANAPQKKAAEIGANYRRAADLAGAGYAAGLAAQSGNINVTASQLHSGAARILGGKITIPVGIDGRYAMSDAERLRYDIKNQIGTIVVPVRAGQSPYANTADNARYRN